MEELTFREVIANIKEGEVWESEYLILKCINGEIEVHFKYRGIMDSYIFSKDTKYVLQRKEYSFAEAFKAYEEGKEIESEVTGERYRKINDIDKIYDDSDDIWDFNEFSFDLKEIRGVWYING